MNGAAAGHPDKLFKQFVGFCVNGCSGFISALPHMVYPRQREMHLYGRSYLSSDRNGKLLCFSFSLTAMSEVSLTLVYLQLNEKTIDVEELEINIKTIIT